MKRSKYHIKTEERYRKLVDVVGEDTLRHWVEDKKYVAGMIKDLLVRDYPHLYDGEFFTHENNHSLPSIRKCLKYAGLNPDKEYYLSQSNEWRYQFRFNENTPHSEIKEWCLKNSIAGQKKTVSRRIKRGTYRNVNFERKWSPLCVEFYLSRGYSLKEAEKRLYEIRTSGTLAALKKTQKPKTEKTVELILKDNCREYSSQYRVKRVDSRKTYVYDFYIPEKNLLIEVNGTYWHCDPRFFKARDIVKHPGKNGAIPFYAEEKWEIDKQKEIYARSRGYDTMIIWEHDLYNNLENVKRKIKEKINEK